MPQWTDDIQLGPVVSGVANTAGASPMTVGVGPMGRTYVWDVVPLTLQAAGLASSQNPGSGGSFTLTAGTGVTTTVDATGVTRYVLDCPRTVSITATGANSATYKVFGYDVYGQPMTQLLAAPSTSTVTTTKTFKSITAVTNQNATAGTNGLTVGFRDTLGMPVVLKAREYIVSVRWAAAGQVDDTGTLTLFDATSPATPSTGDVRGTWGLSSAADGTKRLVMVIAMTGLQVGPTATRVDALGVTQA